MEINRRNPVTIYHHLAIGVVGIVLITITFILGALSNVDTFQGERLVWVMLVAVIPEVVIISIFYGLAIWIIYRFSKLNTLIIKSHDEGQLTVEIDDATHNIRSENEAHFLAHKRGEMKRTTSLGLWFAVSLLMCSGVSLASLLIGNG